MTGINTEIEALKHEIEKTQQSIESLYMELGEVAGQWHKAINYEPSFDSYNELCEIIKVKTDIEGQMNALHGALKEVNSNDQEIAKSQLSMKDLDNHFNILIASFGAVASEVDLDGRLPENLYKCLAPIRDYEKKLASLENKRANLGEKASQFAISSLEKKIARHKSTLNEVFFDTGKRLINTGDYRLVPGQKAQSLIQEMEEVKNLKKNYRGLIKESETNITKAQGELKNMGAYGDESKMLRTLQAKDAQLLGQLEVKFTEYGKILAMGMNEWMVPDAPKAIRDVCRRINNGHIRLTQENLHMDFLMIDREVEVHKNQNAAYVTQLQHLSEQRIQIDKQMADVQTRMDEEKDAINELRQKQNAINRKVEQLSLAHR